MDVIDLVLLLAAAVAFLLAAFGVAIARVGLVPLGLLLWVLVPLIDHIEALS